MDWTTKSKSQELQMQELKNSLNEIEGRLIENNLNLGNKVINSPVRWIYF